MHLLGNFHYVSSFRNQHSNNTGESEKVCNDIRVTGRNLVWCLPMHRSDLGTTMKPSFHSFFLKTQRG